MHESNEALSNSSTQRKQQRTGDQPAGDAAPPWVHFLQSPVLWGAFAAGVFYLVLPRTVIWNDTLQTNFCGHPLAYAATCLFWVGAAALAIKLWQIPGERAALAITLPPNQTGESASDAVSRLDKSIEAMPEKSRRSMAMQRLIGMCDFVRGRKSVAGLDSHLAYLGEFSGEQVHNSYGLVRTITWAVPIIGFLGTVVGITQAIENLDPAKLESSFGLVSQGLGVAFGTTALALGLSLVLVFMAYVVEKHERVLIADVEMLSIGWLTRLFPAEETQSPLADAEAQAATKLLFETDSLIEKQTALWEQSIDTLRTQWLSTCEKQQTQLSDSLTSGVDSSLTAHRDLLSSLTTGWESNIAEFSQALTAQAQAQQQSVAEWQKLAGDQGRLIAVEKQLLDSLHAAEAAASLNETLHSLNAAVHLLTARVRPNAA
jgi:biopolymer transport protein ExbB/TolQ